MEQQYTCPKCFKDYTRFSIQEHYECGVEPLGDGEEIVDVVTAQNPPESPNALNDKPEPKKRGRKPKQRD